MIRAAFRRIAAALLASVAFCPATQAAEAPRLVEKNGRHALLVDGAPYLVLGAQINNSSSWASTLPQVWPALEDMHANTIEAPVYWEQMEPAPGKFDFTTADLLVKGAREHHLHLIVLWFGTWKNGNMHYVPQWIKTDTATYPRVINAAGEPIDVLSAQSPKNLEADKHAFTALMHHLAEIDGTDHTVIMVQVENESGIIGSPRDYSPESNREFAGPVPADLLKALHKQAGTWQQVFGGGAEETFQAYYQAKYVNEIAASGKREFDIPYYCNVWLAYPVNELPERQVPNPGIGWPSGGPVQHMVPLWKTLAPSIDLIGPDIYSDNRQFYISILDTYARSKNALWIPETGYGDSYAPYLYLALGKGAIGFSPFGVDRTGWTWPPAGPNEHDIDPSRISPRAHTENYQQLAPMARELARLNFEGELKTAVDAAGMPEQELDFGKWKASVRFGYPQNDGRPAPGTPDHSGRALVAQIGPDEFLVTGFEASVFFHTAGHLPGIRSQILQAEDGRYEDGHWIPLRLWNGDQTDRGLNFHRSGPAIIHIRMGEF